MLVLIAGITGTMGVLLTGEALKRGHKIRGITRSKSKVPEALQNSSRIEILETPNYFDEDALEKACAGCDAIICAYPIVPRMQLEAQLFLLRAAERAGVKKFVAATWNGDFRRLQLGDMESYDPLICLRTQAALQTTIKPNYVFIGVFAETMFARYHPDSVEETWWMHDRKEVKTWGTGDEPLTVTPQRDAAAYTIHLIERDDAAQGGDWYLYSWRCSLREAAKVFVRATGLPKEIAIQGPVEDLVAMEKDRRAKGSKLNYWEYLGLTYWVNLLTNKLEGAEDDRNEEFPEDCRTDMGEWFVGLSKADLSRPEDA